MIDKQPTAAKAALVQDADWRRALEQAMQEVEEPSMGANPDLVFLFASFEYAPDFPELVASARRSLDGPILVGCSGWGIIGNGREVEGLPGLAILSLSLPGAVLRPSLLTGRSIAQCRTPVEWHDLTGIHPDDVNAWLLLADPFTIDGERLLQGLSEAYPGVPLIGGLASGEHNERKTRLFLDDEVYEEGAVLLAIGGGYRVQTVVSQGCTPIGQTWTITAADGHMIQSIAGRPAYEVLAETVRSLPATLQERARGNLFAGLAMDEYKDDFKQGDFLIRNLLGVEPEKKALIVGAETFVGQTLQFQLRDRVAADDELRTMLAAARGEMGERQPSAGLLFCCNGRGAGLFNEPDHDARAVEESFGPLPLAGFFCNGEIGPVGGRNFLHGYTASLALIVPK